MKEYIPLGVQTSHIYSSSDITGRCPSCYNNNVKLLGQLNIDGTSRDVHKCDSCNKITSGADGGIRGLINEASTIYGTGNVGFTSTGTSAGGTISSPNYGNNGATLTAQITEPVKLDYETKSKFDQMNNNLSNMSSILYNIQTSIIDLGSIIKDLVEKNTKLMEKLATDPLNGMRKSITDFNLK